MWLYDAKVSNKKTVSTNIIYSFFYCFITENILNDDITSNKKDTLNAMNMS